MRFERGQKVGERYTLIERIGSGGMADVWSADDAMLGRAVALKFLHERYAQDAQFIERFRREAQAAAGLQHPNVVSVYDRGEFEGSNWIAMEYVQGASLKDLIARGLTVAESVEIVRQILAGARFAHERGIVHRDLKPHNVLVDAEGRARVTDFGIARAGASEITQTGSVLGTAQYLSPEQAQGFETNATSDLYSVGVILYEALTGRVPFDAETVVAIALKQVSEQAQPPSRLNPDVSPALDAVVLRALAKSPDARFQSAGEFLAALDAAEEDPAAGTAVYPAAIPAVAAAAPIAPDQIADEEPDNRKKLIALALIAALIGALIAFALTRSQQVTVPTVIGETQSEATRILTAKGFAVETSNFESCDEPNTVAEQDPAAGTDTDKGATVQLSVSLGLSVSVPPDVIGMRLDRATKLLQEENLQVRDKEAFSNNAKPGTVVRTSPSVGDRVECETVVTLFASKGANLVELPSFIGMTETEASAEARRLGFVPNVETENSDAPANEVIGQDPGPGSQLTKGEEVILIVSNGAGTVVVPNVEGQLRDNAVSTLESRGARNIKVVEQETDDETMDDRVTDQAPSAGTRVRSGDLITIFVAVYVEPVVPVDPNPPPDEQSPRERGSRR